MRSRSAVLVLVLFLSALAIIAFPGNAVAQPPEWISEPLTPVADAWARLRSPNFTLLGDVGEKRLREAARRLEQFRQALGIQLPESLTAVPAPITVVAFAYSRDANRFDRAAFQALPPDRGGPAGATLMTLPLEGPYDSVYGNVYVTYLDLVLSKLLPRIPAWLRSGLIGYYSTFAVAKDGRTARIGMPPQQGALNLLRSGPPMPIAELVSMPAGAEPSAASRMAMRLPLQSWMLVHYLQIGNPARAPQARDYMARLERGEDAVAAFSAALGDMAALDQELHRYMLSATYSYQEVSLASPTAKPADYQFARLPEAEAKTVRSLTKPGTAPLK